MDHVVDAHIIIRILELEYLCEKLTIEQLVSVKPLMSLNRKWKEIP